MLNKLTIEELNEKNKQILADSTSFTKKELGEANRYKVICYDDQRRLYAYMLLSQGGASGSAILRCYGYTTASPYPMTSILEHLRTKHSIKRIGFRTTKNDTDSMKTLLASGFVLQENLPECDEQKLHQLPTSSSAIAHLIWNVELTDEEVLSMREKLYG